MLNIGAAYQIGNMIYKSSDTKNGMIPITFTKKNICVHCGRENTLVFVDIYGRETKSEVHPFDHIECCRCTKKYAIRWEKETDTVPQYYPTACDNTIKNNILGAVKYPVVKIVGGAENFDI